ncbi:MAG: metallophosphoesterase family protein [Peptococcaceae bacterium]
MLIGVISDTHLPKKSRGFPPEVREGLRGAALIIHAGDVVEECILDELAGLAPVIAVAGNIDSERIKEKYPAKRIMEIEKVKIGICHGHGKSGKTIERAFKSFAGDKVNLIIFGHSHQPVLTEMNGVVMFNPGSPTDPRREPRPSYGMIQVAEGLFNCTHIFLERSR